MKIDLHVHTANSDDAAGEPEEVLDAARQAGLDGIAITEHDCYERSEVFLELGPKYGLAVFVGAEVATRAGHMLVFSEGISRWSRCGVHYDDAQALIDEALNAGGAVVAAHPFRMALGFGGALVKKLRGLAAIEVLNGANSEQENERAAALAASLGLPATGGSDAHRPAEVGRCYTIFDLPVHTMAELAAALKSGRCRIPGMDK